jgi:hypothetical protein
MAQEAIPSKFIVQRVGQCKASKVDLGIVTMKRLEFEIVRFE